MSLNGKKILSTPSDGKSIRCFVQTEHEQEIERLEARHQEEIEDLEAKIEELEGEINHLQNQVDRLQRTNLKILEHRDENTDLQVYVDERREWEEASWFTRQKWKLFARKRD